MICPFDDERYDGTYCYALIHLPEPAARRKLIEDCYRQLPYAINHVAFGINSEISDGWDVVISTAIMGGVWGWIYRRTGSLRCPILAHFPVDFLALAAPAFLNRWEKGTW